jgi:mono/diheme cytochrome c family protein
MRPPCSRATIRAVKRWLLVGLGALAVLFLVAQLVPYGRDHANPPVTKEVAWSSPATERLVAGACYDCHSNRTTWPWYASIAPVSWLVQHDVDEGRATLNFSEWDRPQSADAAEIVEAVREGEMPPLQYELLHGAARLSSAERDALARGLETTLAGSPPAPGG